jgi:hypothetical protein
MIVIAFRSLLCPFTHWTPRSSRPIAAAASTTAIPPAISWPRPAAERKPGPIAPAGSRPCATAVAASMAVSAPGRARRPAASAVAARPGSMAPARPRSPPCADRPASTSAASASWSASPTAGPLGMGCLVHISGDGGRKTDDRERLGRTFPLSLSSAICQVALSVIRRLSAVLRPLGMGCFVHFSALRPSSAGCAASGPDL